MHDGKLEKLSDTDIDVCIAILLTEKATVFVLTGIKVKHTLYQRRKYTLTNGT